METTQVICDSDIMIDYLDRKKKRHDAIKQLFEKEIGLDFVTISVITKMELIAGALNKADLLRVKQNFGRFNSLLINHEISSIAFQLVSDYKLSYYLPL